MAIQAHIRQQPELVSRAIAAANAADGILPPEGQLVMVGSGSSYNALLAAADTAGPELRPLLHVVGPAAYLRTGRGRTAGTAASVLVLSQSGASTTSVAAAEAAADRGVAAAVVTCEAGSPIAGLAVPKLVLSIGGEPIGPKTKGFTATLAAVLALVARRDGRLLPPFSPEALAALIGAADGAALDLAGSLADLDHLVVAGSGRFLGIALEASLKITEVAGLPAAGFETEELLHGRLHGVGPHGLVTMIAADRGEVEIAVATAKAMADRDVRVRLLNLTSTPTPHDWLRIAAPPAPLDTLAAVVPFQWLAVHLARARGLTPETMRYPGLSAALAIKLAAPR